MDSKPSAKGAWLSHVNHFSGHQPYLWNDCSYIPLSRRSSQMLST